MTSDSRELSSRSATYEADWRKAQEDLELVRKSLEGDAGAIDALMERLECVARILAARNARLGSPLDSAELEDVVQETLIRIWRKREEFLGTGPLETWAHRFCYLEFMNRLRAKSRRSAPIEPLDVAHAQTAVAPVDRPAVEYEPVLGALNDIGLPDSEVVRLKHFDGLTFDEIGHRLAISPNTAKTQYYRGLEKLRTRLSRDDYL